MAAENDQTHLWKLVALAETLQQWGDAEQFLLQLVSHDNDFSTQEAEKIGSYYSLCTAVRRSEWRGLKKWEHMAPEEEPALREMQKRLASSLEQWYERVEESSKRLATRASSPHAKLIFQKAQADHLRYHFEDFREQHLDTAKSELSLAEYTQALAQAEETLSPVDPLRLSLALNSAVALYTLAGKSTQAITQAQCALDAALSRAEEVPKDSLRAVSALLQSMRDNMMLWSAKSSITL